jgi:superfamily II DNA/RNA helicase
LLESLGTNGKPKLIVACPGRLLSLIDDATISLSALSILVLDEADRLLEPKDMFFEEVSQLLSHVDFTRGARKPPASIS